MKRFKKLFILLMILPIFSICFIGCSKNKEVTLTNENISDYIIFNYTYDDVGSIDNRCPFIFTIETTKKYENITFNDCKFTFSFLEISDSYTVGYTTISQPQEIHVNYNGESKFSFYANIQANKLDDFAKNFEFKITDVSGTVIKN